MSKAIFSVVLMLISITSFGQIWKPIKNKLQADYLVYETKVKSELRKRGTDLDGIGVG